MSKSGRVKFAGHPLVGRTEKTKGWGKRTKRKGLVAIESRPSLFESGRPIPPGNHNLIGLLMFSNIVFNLTDLTTTLFALGNGLREGNALVLGMSVETGIGVFASLIAVKALFVAGAALVALFGIRSASKTGRNLALTCLASSTLLFFIISLNNIYWIVT
jgi:hypothetical protein